MELEKNYDASKFEDAIYKKWEDSGAFEGKVDNKKKPFSISMPPPNATGTLHLGHATMLAIQDIMIRFHKMKGYSTLWLPGTDHAAIATQSVVEKKLQEKGMTNPRKELGREKLLEEIKKFVKESKSTIKNQTKKMGASCDWSREKYTMDTELETAVFEIYKRMHNDKIIYRGYRSINWDPKMQTTVADDELKRIKETVPFYYFQYGPFVIGTARPETKFGDKIVVVHPDDERYKKYHGQEFDVEWINGPIKCKVIPDKAIDPKFGTGVMTITPAHSSIDFDIAMAHPDTIEIEQIIGFDGRMLPIAQGFEGMTILECRKALVEKMEKKGLIVKIDNNYEHEIAVNYRGKGVIEPQIMRQWFVNVNKPVIDWKGKKLSLKEVMIDTVSSGMIEITPKKFEKIYFNWINNLRDWCISRQIWWGHQIPIWYKLTNEQFSKYNELPIKSSYIFDLLEVEHEGMFSVTKPTSEGNWVRDPDTLDTWFSSALWTFSTLGWPEKTKELKYFHPTSVMETGYDIIFFWVARMILASTYALRKDGIPEEKSIPFKKVYLHGMIRDKNGKKMSKSNPETSIDPLDVIAKYGTDAVRLSLIIGSTPGNDMNLYEEKIAGYRNFINKIWNSARFALMNIENLNKEIEIDTLKVSDKWILTKTNTLILEVTKEIENQQFSNAGNKIYEFLWGTYCDWYLEMSKVSKNEAVLAYVLKTILKLLHPFTPFVTEVLWTHLDQEKMIINEDWPKPMSKYDFNDAENKTEKIIEIIKEIRNLRKENKVNPVKKIKVILSSGLYIKLIHEKKDIIKQMANLSKVEIKEIYTENKDCASSIIHGTYIDLPFADMIDQEQDQIRIKKDIIKNEQIIEFIEKKLSNKGFTDNAPKAVIDKETDRLNSAKEKLAQLLKQSSK